MANQLKEKYINVILSKTDLYIKVDYQDNAGAITKVSYAPQSTDSTKAQDPSTSLGMTKY
jgi:hypothetical protein